MDDKEMPEESINISVPSSAGNVDAISPTPFRNVWATVLDFTIEVAISTVCFTLLFIAAVACLPSAVLASGWKRVFIVSCLAVSFDSLFLYIPIIDEEHKCLGTDMTLRNVALALRSFTDLTFIVHIFFLINGVMDIDRSNSDPVGLSFRMKLARKLMTKKIVGIFSKISWLSFSIIINFVAILPFPQVAILVGFLNGGGGGSNYFFEPPIINMLLIFQVLLRSSQIILSMNKIVTDEKWVKGSIYFLLYFIASHVIAAFWYFFSIQRETSCWDEACRAIAGCVLVYNCGHSTSFKSTILNKSCPIDSSDATTFDFGMYRGILKSGNTGYTDFSKKFFYHFWWSLKNLSNFGTNLETSSYVWENCFAILICVIGLLLFIILIGNVQTYIQSETEKSVKIGEARRAKLVSKYKDTEEWMLNHGLTDDMKNYIWKNFIEDKVVELINEDVDTDFIMQSYERPMFTDDRSDPVNFVFVNALKKIPLLRYMDEQVLLKAFCGYGAYNITTQKKDSYITRAGKPLDTLYVIMDGTIEEVQTQRRLDCCGEEVLHWAVLNHNKSAEQRDPLPNGTVDVKCLTKVVAFYFTADELIWKLKHFNKLAEALAHNAPDTTKANRGIKDWLLRNGFPEVLKANIMNFLAEKEKHINDDVDVVILFDNLQENIKPSINRHLGMNALKKVPMLRKMHDYILEIICNHLEPAVYTMNSYVVREGEPLGFMIFILGGKAIITNTTSSNAATTSSTEITEPSDEIVLERGGYYGEQLLSWASPNNISSSDNLVISTGNVKCQNKVEALILKAEELKRVASKCGSQWNLIDSMSSQQLVFDGRDTVPALASTIPNNEQIIQLHQGHDMLLEQLILIRETVFQLRSEMATIVTYLGYKGAFSHPPAP